MEPIHKSYKWHRRIRQLRHQGPRLTLRWIMADVLSSLERTGEEFPIAVSVEVTNHCNLACSTCPQPYLSSGEKGYMNTDLFQKIVDECCRYPSLTSIVITGFGEPLLHPQLIPMSRYAKGKKIPIVRTYTNCILLNKQRTEELLLRSGFDEITLSLNAATQENYERITKSQRYELATENIKNFLTTRKALKARTPFVNLQLLKLKDVPLNIEKFVNDWRSLLKKGDCISIKPSHSFGGEVKDPGVGTLNDPRKRVPCGQLWNSLSITWNGDVIPCCADPFKKLKIGNVRDSSLKDLWHSSRIMHMRDIHMQKEYDRIPQCRHCETWRYFIRAANNPIAIFGRFLSRFKI
jgi:radical SAM protein with 4Fe4S-binding SPASM domain